MLLVVWIFRRPRRDTRMPSNCIRPQVASFEQVPFILSPPLLHWVLKFEVRDNERDWNLTFAQEFPEEPEDVQL